MAEHITGAFLSSFFQMIFDRLASSNFTDYFRRGKLDKLMEELESTLESINQVLDDAEIKQYQIPNVKKWLGDVKHAMYEADQLLDEISSDASLKKMKVESQPSTSSKFLGYFSAFNNSFESRIKELLKNLKHLAEQKDVFGLKNGTWARNEDGVNSKPLERPPTSYLVDASRIYGRDDEKDEMVKILLSNNGSDNQTPVSSIVGLGGMGKTTFAKLVYNERRIEDHFELKAWVYVSEPFDVVGLTKAILKSFNSSADDESIFNLLQDKLQHILTGKKYLLVLDDIWNGNADYWEQLLLPFNHGSFGSKIIVTTRDKEVAYVLNSTKIFDLQQLDKRDCWSLFVTHAFHGKNTSEYPNLESIGKKIVNKCGGLPLAVKTMGQLLRKKFSQHEWIKILETDMWCLSDVDNNINPVLRLSYHNLPSNQKRCFSFCSIFPKGSRFGKDELIKLWMAEGLLKCCGAGKSEEELGNEIFSDLESISFFQQPYHLIVGRYKNHFVMHDLINDLANSVLEDFFVQINGCMVEGIPERTRHIRCSLQLTYVDKSLEPICQLKGLRSLLLKGDGSILISNDVQRDMFSQKLKIFSCGELEMSIPKADNIIELEIKGCDRILINQLSSSLKKFVLSGIRYAEFSQAHNLINNPILEGSELDLGCYNSLHTLCLKGWNFSLPCSLHLFTNLHSLELLDCPELDSFSMGGSSSNLRYLHVHNCPKLIASREVWGLWFQLSFLKVLRLSDKFESVESFPDENLLPPSLESLYLYECSKLRITNFKGFLHLKSLKSLFIADCPSLERLPEDGLPKSLSYLEIRNCPLLKEMYQKEEGARWHTIRHIPLVFIV